MRALPMPGFGRARLGQMQPVGAYAVSAEVSWNDGLEVRSVVLKTLRLGAKEPER